MRFRSFCLPALLLATAAARAQGTPNLWSDLQWLTNTPAVSGYESALVDRMQKELSDLHPKRDAMGNLTVTFGSGGPGRLIVAPLDEPGYVVSEILPDGYMRVQRLPQTGLPPHWNEMHNAQPITIGTKDGKLLPAVTTGLSIHLTPGRLNVPDPDDLDAFYLDAGARTGADVLRSGIDVLSPVAADRSLLRVGDHAWAGTAVGDRFGAAVLLQLARSLATAKPQGTITLAFVTQQWVGSRGLTRLLQATHPEELVYLGRGRTAPRADAAKAPAAALGSGPVSFTSTAAAGDGLGWLKASAMQTATAPSMIVRGYGEPIAPPAHTSHLSVPMQYPLTAGEMIDDRDLTALLNTLMTYTGAAGTPAGPTAATSMTYAPVMPRPASTPTSLDLLKTLTVTYGVSEQEKMTREAVAQLLPPWAHTETDAGGNLILHMGKPGGGKGIVIMAHTDELGFRIKSINADGSIELDNKGGGSPPFYWGHPALVHTAAGMRGAVVDLPANYDTAAFHFPADFRVAAKLNVGATSAAQVDAQGIHVGDFVTIPKHFSTLLDGRVSVRSLDDRVGCAALVHAVWELGKDFSRDVTFVWSTREELGLLGAGEYAEATAKAGQVPATVFAIDTFVSSDSPIESHRFADGKLGDGFVIRAIDGSNIVPWTDVQRVTGIATSHKIPVQYGITGGGNDGAAFTRFGSTDVTLSWPLRYSHSPAELIDTRDLDALSAITAALAREW